MPEEMPKSPFKSSGIEKSPVSEEIRAVTGIFELTRRLRAKNPENPEDVDKLPGDIEESVGDHIAMTTYLMHYFMPILEKSGEALDSYERTFDMVLAHSAGDAFEVASMPGVQKTTDDKRQEILNSAKLFGELPRRGGLNRHMFNAYAEYVGQETREARFVRALNGLSTMLYVLSRPPEKRTELVGGKGYALEDYRERIGQFCTEFRPLHDFYTRIERVLHQGGNFAPSRRYENARMRPEVAKAILLSSAPAFSTDGADDPDAENSRLLKLFRLKRALRFGQSPKPPSEQHDTDAEHIAALLFLARYFTPIIKSDTNQAGQENISFREVVEILLAHDAPEAITGDRISQIKTEDDAVQERLAAVAIAQEHAPRAEGFNFEFLKRFLTYEEGKAASLTPSSATLAKALDVLEGQFYIYDPETREKLQRMRIMSRLDVDNKAGKFIRLFPTLNTNYEALNQRFIAEGLF